MRVRWAVAICVGLALGAWAAETPKGEKVADGVEKLTCRGWKDCYRLSNPACEAIVAPAVGSRIVSFAFKGKNVLLEDRTLDGRAMTPQDHDDENRYWLPWDGSQPDMFDDKGFRQFYPAWMGAYKVAQAEPFRLVTECIPQQPQQGDAHCVKTFALDPKKLRLTFGYTMANRGKEPRTWALLQRTMLPAPGILLLPLKRRSAFEGGWKVMEPEGGEVLTTGTGKRILERVKEHIIVSVGDCIAVAPQMLGAKSKVFVFDSITLHTDGDAGWMAWLVGDVAFVMQFPVESGAKRLRPNVVTQNWFTSDRMELCPFGPLAEVKPGGSVSFDTVWTFVPLDKAVAEPKDAKGLRRTIERAIR